MFTFSRSEFFNFELIRILTTAPYGGCDIAEFLEAVGQIKDSPDRWHRAWQAQGEKAEAVAKEATEKGDVTAARRAHLRACNYFRASQYMMFDRPSSPDARVMPIFQRSMSNFQRAIKLLDGPVKHLEIPYGKHRLPAYLYLPPPGKRLPGKIPVVVNTGGADSTQEEHYFMLPVAGPDLGYAILTFEGPGQGIVLRQDQLHHRPDWEVVTGSVLDYLFDYSSTHPELELDLHRLSIAGASMGGYYAIRGASDPRIKACVALDPFYSLWDFILARLPERFINLWLAGWVPDSIFNTLSLIQAKISFQSKWEFMISTWMFGVETPPQLMHKVRQFTLKRPDGSEFLDCINCPILITGAAHSIYFKPEDSTMKIYNNLTRLREDQKQVWIPTDPSDGGLQAKMGALGLLQHRTFMFLDEQLGIQRASLLANGSA